FVDGVAAVARGSIGGAAKLVEDALAKALPVVIGFLASLLGISGLAEKAQKVLLSLRARRDKCLDGIILKAEEWDGKFIGKATGAGKGILKLAFTKHKGFQAGGESHETWIAEDGEPQVASRAVSLATRIRDWQRRIPALPEADRGTATSLLTTC